MLPEPALTLTLPSLHDGLPLDCRIYHPLALAAANPRAPPFLRHAAVVAHPYAPLGGSYDDPIVEAVAALLLRRGFVVVTFNFRGAGGSAGKTSWTARAEREDYGTVVGFLVHYVHYLDPFGRRRGEGGDQTPYQSRQTSEVLTPPVETAVPERPYLLCAGYSYGAIITTHLAPLDTLLRPFTTPAVDSHAGHVRLRAQHLAEQQNLVLGSARAAMLEHRGPRSSSKRGVRIGGEEGGGSPRKSHDGRRSFSLDAEDIRRGVHELVAKARVGRHGHGHGHRPSTGTKTPVDVEKTAPEGPMARVLDLLRPQPAYLLISPPQGLATHLATFSLIPSALVKNKSPEDVAAEEKLVQNPTMAVYGDADSFVPVGKLRAWREKMEKREGSRFKGEEVLTAGHFWVEEGVLERLRGFAGGFVDGLLV